MEPFLVDAKWFTHMRRPRLFEVQAAGELGHPQCWIDAGFAWIAAKKNMFTFTTCRARSGPLQDPVGLSAATEGAKQRWAKHKWIGQVYMYKRMLC